MASELVRRLIAANEGSQQTVLGSDIFYKAAERIDFLERTISEVLEENAHLADGDVCTLIKLKRANEI